MSAHDHRCHIHMEGYMDCGHKKSCCCHASVVKSYPQSLAQDLAATITAELAANPTWYCHDVTDVEGGHVVTYRDCATDLTPEPPPDPMA